MAQYQPSAATLLQALAPCTKLLRCRPSASRRCLWASWAKQIWNDQAIPSLYLYHQGHHSLIFTIRGSVIVYLAKIISAIKGPDNPTSQALPIIRKSGWSGTEKEEKTKEMVEGPIILKVVCEELCVRKLCVWKSCVWKVVSERVVCERLWVKELCVKGCLWQSCVWKSCVWQSCFWQSCVWKIVCVTKLCVKELCVTKLCVTKLCVTKMCLREKLHVREMCVCVKDCVWQSCVKELCVTKLCVTKLCDKDVCEREVACERDVCVCERLRVTKLCVRELCMKKLCAKELRLTKLCAIKLHVRKRCDRLCVTKLRVTKSYLREMDSLAAWMSPSATPATQNEECHACHACQPSAISASQLPKVLQTRQFFTLLTSKCASRHNGVHFFDVSTCKSAPMLVRFVHFDFEMCFAPQRRAIFHLSSGQRRIAPHSTA